jgi:hypothetical protein
LSNILLSRLSPYVDEIIGDHKCWFWCNRSSTDQIFCIRQILKKKLEYNETVSAIRRFQERLRFSEEGSNVQYSDRVWGTHEAS